MDTNKVFTEKVEHYVGQIISRSMDEVKSLMYRNRKIVTTRVTDDRGINTTTCGTLNLNKTSVQQFAERLVDDFFSESLREVHGCSEMKSILCVGTASLDLVNICEGFPVEGKRTNAAGHYWTRGGNAANTATVLALLGARGEYFGTLVKNNWTKFLQSDFKRNGVSIENCIYLDQNAHRTPLATWLINQNTGTLSLISDFKGITGPTCGQFLTLNLSNYSWIHIELKSFDGHPKELADILDLIRKHNETNEEKDKVVISLEVEQPHNTDPECFTFLGNADIVFINKDYAINNGYKAKEDAVRGLYKTCKPGSVLACVWGSNGAAAMSKNEIVCSPAYPPEKLVDKVGAEATFNAGFIYALSRGKGIKRAVEFGCVVAGHKCGHRGFECVKGISTKL